MNRIRTLWCAAVTALGGLLAPGALSASPDDARHAAAGIIRAVSAGDCAAVPDNIRWPLKVDGENVARSGWPEICRDWRTKLLTARIQRVFSPAEAAALFDRLALPDGELFLADAVRGVSPASETPNGFSLVFDCTSVPCRLVGLVGRLLHRSAYEGMAPRPSQQRALLASRLAGALGSLGPIRVAMLEHFYSRGQWPASGEALGLDPARLHSREIESIELADQGRIRAHLSQDFGAGRILELRPYSELSGTAYRWQCYSNLPGEVLSLLGGISCKPLATGD